MPTWGIILLVIVAIIVVIIGLFAGVYNSLVKLDERVNEAWSDITVQLKYRADLIPNVVETVKGYAKHEKETFQMVTEARSAVMGAKTVKQAAEAEKEMPYQAAGASGEAAFRFRLCHGCAFYMGAWLDHCHYRLGAVSRACAVRFGFRR